MQDPVLYSPSEIGKGEHIPRLRSVEKRILFVYARMLRLSSETGSAAVPQRPPASEGFQQ